MMVSPERFGINSKIVLNDCLNIVLISTTGSFDEICDEFTDQDDEDKHDTTGFSIEFAKIFYKFQMSVLELENGVPQGTKIGPITFHGVSNDAAHAFFYYWKYVDDITFAENGNCKGEAIYRLILMTLWVGSYIIT